jgi:hypothetical protein
VSITTTLWLCSIALIAAEKLATSFDSLTSTELLSARSMQ